MNGQRPTVRACATRGFARASRFSHEGRGGPETDAECSRARSSAAAFPGSERALDQAQGTARAAFGSIAAGRPTARWQELAWVGGPRHRQGRPPGLRRSSCSPTPSRKAETAACAAVESSKKEVAGYFAPDIEGQEEKRSSRVASAGQPETELLRDVQQVSGGPPVGVDSPPAGRALSGRRSSEANTAQFWNPPSHQPPRPAIRPHRKEDVPPHTRAARRGRAPPRAPHPRPRHHRRGSHVGKGLRAAAG
jgi:hypothetical protein